VGGEGSDADTDHVKRRRRRRKNNIGYLGQATAGDASERDI
jgi:hypothetical protein